MTDPITHKLPSWNRVTVLTAVTAYEELITRLKADCPSAAEEQAYGNSIFAAILTMKLACSTGQGMLMDA